ncbi:WYL domain-containing protein (plasmid) [Burkholderia humptydooensis]|uniref:WYL domain-containing protein n=1 Tax=Burkholderia humptydooensis TaxID=430531 RepID=A0A7U4SU95_9BURK|nr:MULTISPECIES: WYL domain-containing protein [Burkholderia]AJY38127.1 WYL domain protein [Burkholderia sp. 2002721687]ALX44633.1 hypothetical protein AQ610_19025 [Burkholderia humptydooensis]QPS41985.1 WYL domain-containing protein [Burkholderia humptydooensis]
MPSSTHKTPASDIPLTVRQRLAHLERCLFWKGELQRADLVDTFGINPAQAAADFRLYMELAPGNMDYDKSRKRYLPAPGFAPELIEPASVDEFVAVQSARVVAETWPLPVRTASSEVLQSMVGAIRMHNAIEIQYQSMTAPKPSWRWISPHAFASDGERWHVRAYCHKRNAFRDFVLGRIVSTRHARASDIDYAQDIDWRTYVSVVVKPNPELSADQRAAIATEYNMPRSQEVKLRLRRSMLFYLRARFAPQPDSVPAAHQLVVSDPEAD